MTSPDMPRLRPEVVLGPALRSGPKTVHHIKDASTGCFYRVGPREHFIMGLMDGRHTIQDIGRRYRETYDRTLGPDSWQQMFTLLGRYQLLDGYADTTVLDSLRQAQQDRQAARQGLLRRRWVLLQPDRLCAAAAARLAFAFRSWFVVPALALIAVLQIVVWSHAAALAHDAGHQRSWAVAVPALLVLGWLITMVHELAHGVTCRHFGGTVTEIGLSWRFPLLTPYCRTDDIVLFHRRRARVGTAFAGVFAGLLSLAPVTLWWALTSGGGAGHRIASALLLFGSAGSLMSLLPFLRSDGYVMLTHTLDLVDLRRESYRFWLLRLRRRDPGARERLRSYPSRDARAYSLYGIATLVVAVPAYCALMWVWFARLRHWTGPGWAVVVLAAETLVLAALLLGAARGRGGDRRTADA